MGGKLRALPGFKSGKEPLISMLLTQAVVSGIFIGAYNIAAYSLLLSVLDQKMMAGGFIVSAVILLLFYNVFRAIRKSLSSGKVFNLTFSFAAIIIGLFWIINIVAPGPTVTFCIFVLNIPFSFILPAALKNILDTLNKKGEVYLPPAGISSAISAGIIISSLLAALLCMLGLKPDFILLIAPLSALTALVFNLVRRSELNIVSPGSNSYEGFFPGIDHFDKEGSSSVILAYSLLSVVAMYFVQYIFMTEVKSMFITAGEIAVFLGFFTGVSFLIQLILELYFYKTIHERFGLRVTLLILPVFALAMIVLASFSVGLAGNMGETSIWIVIFFAFITAAGFSFSAFRQTFSVPAEKLTFFSINKLGNKEGIRIDDILLFSVGILLAGILLAVAGLINGIKLIHLTLILLLILITWAISSISLLKKYKRSLFVAVYMNPHHQSVTADRHDLQSINGRFASGIHFRYDHFKLISNDLGPIDEAHNDSYFLSLAAYATLNGDINLIPALRKIILNAAVSELTRKRCSEALLYLQDNENTSHNVLSAAYQTLSGVRKPLTTDILRLLRDPSVEAKRAAIHMIGKFGLTDMAGDVCNCLTVPELIPDAAAVLDELGPGVENDLIKLYLGSSSNPRLSATILELLGSKCYPANLSFIFSRLWSNSRILKELSLNALIKCRYIPDQEEKARLDSLIDEAIGLITWTYSSLHSLGKNKGIAYKAIVHESERWTDYLINLLSLGYGKGVISDILDNFRDVSGEGVEYASDMSVVLFSDQIKHKIIALLTPGSLEEKLQNLALYYPVTIIPEKKLLEDILNMDYNLITIWTKVSAIKAIDRLDTDEIRESVIALLFSPEEIVREEAACLLARSAVSEIDHIPGRLSPNVRLHIEPILTGSYNKNDLLYEKVTFLSAQLRDMYEDDLVMLASGMLLLLPDRKLSVVDTGSYIQWDITGEKTVSKVTVRYDRADTETDTEIVTDGSIAYILPLYFIEKYCFLNREKSLPLMKYVAAYETFEKSGAINET